MPWRTLLSTSHKLELCVHVYYNYNVRKKERSRKRHILLPITLVSTGQILPVWWVFWRTKAANMWTTWEWNRILLLQWMEMLIWIQIFSSHTSSLRLSQQSLSQSNILQCFFLFHLPIVQPLFLETFIITVKYNRTREFIYDYIKVFL